MSPPDLGGGATKTIRHRWSIELLLNDGSLVGPYRIEPDFEPAFECARLSGIRSGQLDRFDSRPGVLEPVWHPSLGRPFVERVIVHVPDAGAAKGSCELPFAYFAPIATTLAKRLAEVGRLEQREICGYLVAAEPTDAEPPGPESGDDPEPITTEVRATEQAGAPSSEPAPPVASELDFRLEDAAPPLVLAERRLAPLLWSSEPFGPAVAEDELAVFLPAAVLAETRELARRAGQVETGGFLLGGLERDSESRDLFVRVRAQIPAEHARGERARLELRSETWAAAADAVRRRGRGEELIGWWHFHPDFCRACGPERRKTCSLRSTFFSAEDVRLHRLCFTRAHQIALLVSDDGSEPLDLSLFGWRDGTLTQRGFRVVAGDDFESGGADHA